MRGTLPLLLSLTLLPSGACDHACTLLACGRTLLRLSGPWSLLESKQGQIKVCIAARCSTAPVWSPPAGPSDPGHWIGPFSGALLGGGVVSTQPALPGQALMFDLQVYVDIPKDTADGDRYELRVDDPATGAAAAQAWSATYFETRPNGPGCEPACRSPSLTPL